MSIEQVLIPPLRDLGDGFQVKRSLPAPRQRAVGPFVFFDQMGPVRLAPGRGFDVRPHPHIGLATVTYLFDGEIMHRDSLGNEQPIRPAEVNWMIAGSGVVHSERTSPQRRRTGSTLFGLQSWVALPRHEEERPASFRHYGSADLPVSEGDGISVRLIAGSLGGARSPVETLSEMLYADIALNAGVRYPVSAEHAHRALYIVQGRITIGSESLDEGRMVVLQTGEPVVVLADIASRVMLLGGAPLDGPRHLWWNFVSSSPERIEQAKRDWREQRFGRVPGDDEFIPLPPDRP